jgi:hypothetical protein
MSDVSTKCWETLLNTMSSGVNHPDLEFVKSMIEELESEGVDDEEIYQSVITGLIEKQASSHEKRLCETQDRILKDLSFLEEHGQWFMLLVVGQQAVAKYLHVYCNNPSFTPRSKLEAGFKAAVLKSSSRALIDVANTFLKRVS